MKILVTGGTGNVGGAVVNELLRRNAEVRILARKQPEPGKFPEGVEVALGDLLDPVSVEQALNGVGKLFLLNAVVTDELTQALIAYGGAKRIGIKHVTYLSVFKVDQFRDVPHFASKLAVESALREFGVPYTILRPGYFIQNDLNLQGALTGAGVYPMPIGTAGIAAADVRDIAEAAAISLTEDGHDGQTYDIVTPTTISGPGNAALWANCWTRRSGTQDITSINGSKACAPGCRIGAPTIFGRCSRATSTAVLHQPRRKLHALRSYWATRRAAMRASPLKRQQCGRRNASVILLRRHTTDAEEGVMKALRGRGYGGHPRQVTQARARLRRYL